jgi:hypothetical protein
MPQDPEHETLERHLKFAAQHIGYAVDHVRSASQAHETQSSAAVRDLVELLEHARERVAELRADTMSGL